MRSAAFRGGQLIGYNGAGLHDDVSRLLTVGIPLTCALPEDLKLRIRIDDPGRDGGPVHQPLTGEAASPTSTTQARHLRELDATARDLVAVMADVEPGTVETMTIRHRPRAR